MPDKEAPLARHLRVVDAAEETDFVINHAGLRMLGVDRNQAARQVAAGRWERHGTQTFSVRTGPLGQRAQCWRAVWEVGERVTLVDGVTALALAGLKGWRDDVIHVSIVHRHDPSNRPGVKVHKVIRRVEGESAGDGLPRTKPAVAAIRAAHWARSDRAVDGPFEAPAAGGLRTSGTVASRRLLRCERPLGASLEARSRRRRWSPVAQRARLRRGMP